MKEIYVEIENLDEQRNTVVVELFTQVRDQVPVSIMVSVNIPRAGIRGQDYKGELERIARTEIQKYFKKTGALPSTSRLTYELEKQLSTIVW